MPRVSNNSRAMRPSSGKMLLNAICLLKKPGLIWEIAESSVKQEMFTMILEHLIPEIKEPLKD